ncbi:MAG: phytoene/squalene synthase family protein [Alkalispirochaeta sp.]
MVSKDQGGEMYGTGTVHYETFRNGSTTYFNSSRFFPESVRRDVFALYGFVRVADNFVDSVPQDADGFHRFVDHYHRALERGTDDDPIIGAYVELSRRKRFDPKWTDAFLRSMAMDLTRKQHRTLPESLAYIYGSAEVIGLFMAQIMDLDSSAREAAQMLGRAMQYINFIRDIAEDNSLGRIYLPISETSLESLDEAYLRENSEEFVTFIHSQLQRYMTWQAEAEAGYPLIPRRYRIPIKTAGDMYKWTGQQIAENPFIVFRRKVKPNRARIVFSGLFNAIYC